MQWQESNTGHLYNSPNCDKGHQRGNPNGKASKIGHITYRYATATYTLCKRDIYVEETD